MQTALIVLSLSKNLGIEVALLAAAAAVAGIWELFARRLDDRRDETAAGRKSRVRLQTWYRIRAGITLVGVAVVVAVGPGRTPDTGEALFWTVCALLAGAGGVWFFYRAYRTRQDAQ